MHAEVKYATATICDTTFNSSIDRGGVALATDVMPCLPAIPEGDEVNQRHGRKVNGRYLYVKGYVAYDNSTIYGYGSGNAVTMPAHGIVVRLIIATQRNIRNCAGMNPSPTGASTVNTDTLLAPYDGTTITKGFSGDVKDLMYPINKDVFRVHLDKKIKLRPQMLGTLDSGTAWTMGQNGVYFHTKIKCPPTLYFDETIDSNSRPTNFAPFMVLGWADTDGVTPTSDRIVRCTATSTLYYTDP